MWDGVKALIAEIKRCEEAGATVSAVAMAYVCIDTMAFLSLPVGREIQGRADFISWVDTYMKGHKAQPYQYRGLVMSMGQGVLYCMLSVQKRCSTNRIQMLRSTDITMAESTPMTHLWTSTL